MNCNAHSKCIKQKCITQWFGKQTTFTMTQINKRYCQLPRSPSHTLPVIIPAYCVPTRVTTVSRGIHCLASLRSFNTPAWITKFYSLISSAFSIVYYIHGNMPHAFFPLTSGFLCSAICLRDSPVLLLWFRTVHSLSLMHTIPLHGFPAIYAAIHCGWIFGSVPLGGYYG